MIEAELKRQESDFLVWHGDEIRRRRPHNRLKKLVGSIRKGKAASDQGKLAFRRTEVAAAPAEPAVEVNQGPEEKGLFRLSEVQPHWAPQKRFRCGSCTGRRLAPDVLEAVSTIHLRPNSGQHRGPLPGRRPTGRDEQHAAALHVAAQVVERDPPELERARVGPGARPCVPRPSASGAR